MAFNAPFSAATRFANRKTDSNMSNRRSLLAMATCLIAVALGVGGSADVVPWPFGQAPSDADLVPMVEDALALAVRERAEEFLEARDQGEDSEHVVLRQDDIDAELYGYATLPRLFQFGDALFGHEFRAEDGYGDSLLPQLQRVHSGVRGGLDTFSCAGCHSVGGADGAGALTQNAFLNGDGDHLDTATVRNAPHVLGLGFVQLLGVEMSAELQAQRDAAVSQALSTASPVSVDLASKGVPFGKLIVSASGVVDTSGAEGIDADLVVRPFGWKGDVARLRRFVEDAARVHFGVQSHVLALEYEKNPDVAHLGPGPNWYDPDNDGKIRELEEGILTAGGVYLTLLEVPVIIPPFDPGLQERWNRGSQLYDQIGCNDCHKRSLTLTSSVWTELPDTTDGAGIVVRLEEDGDAPRSTKVVELFSDLKRHDMGEGLADRFESPSGVPRSVFITRPLWGLSETPPYLHDGRAPTIPDAILAHGGDAADSRAGFAALSEEERRDLHVYLLSLTRFPKPRVAR